MDTYDSDSSHYSGLGGDPKTANDDEADDSGGVAQHPVAMIDEEHGGGGGDDEAAGVAQLAEDYGLAWIKEMAVGPGDHLFYQYMVSCRAVLYIRGFIVSL